MLLLSKEFIDYGFDSDEEFCLTTRERSSCKFFVDLAANRGEFVFAFACRGQASYSSHRYCGFHEAKVDCQFPGLSFAKVQYTSFYSLLLLDLSLIFRTNLPISCFFFLPSRIPRSP